MAVHRTEEADLINVNAYFKEARNNLIDAALILQQIKHFESTTNDTKQLIGELSIAIKAFEHV